MNIAVVVGDIGGANELMPVVDRLKGGNHLIAWFVDEKGKARSVLQQAAIPISSCDPGKDAGRFDVIVVGTSATAVDAQIEWTRAGLEKKVPVVWYEDLWGAAGKVVKEVSPNHLLVVDGLAAEIARRVRPDLKCTDVGKPTFARLGEFTAERVAEVRHQLRSELRVPSGAFLLVYWSGGDETRVREHLEMLAAVKEEVGRTTPEMDFRCAPRLHPKLAGRDGFWGGAGTSLGRSLIDARDNDPLFLNAAADIVLGEFGGTQTYTAAAMGVLPLIALSPFNEDDRRQCGYLKGVPPLMSKDIAVGVHNAYDVSEQVRRVAAMTTRNGFRRKATEMLSQAMKPGADERIAEAILGFGG